MIEAKVEGLSELRDLLQRRLPEHLQTKALQPALAKAAKPIVNDARARVPVKTGAVRRAITSARSRKSTKVMAVRIIGVNVKRIKRPNVVNGRSRWIDKFYWKQLEFGRAAYVSKRNLGTSEHGFFGRTFQAVPARPFLRPAFESKKYEAVQKFKESMGPEIEKFAARNQSRVLKGLGRKFGL